MDSDKLKQMIDDDDLGLLEVKEKVQNLTPDERLVNSFLEIVNFVELRGHAPQSNNADVNEYKLYSRLKSINSNPEKIEKLLDFDKQGLLKEEKPVQSVSEILEDDDLNLLDDDTDLFKFRNVPKRENLPDYIGRQKPCKDFDQFEHLFKACQLDLRNEKRKLGRLSSEKQIKKGRFFVVRGVMAYVADISPLKKVSDALKIRGSLNARLRLIYENGTESDILLRSLARALYEDGRIITENADETLNIFEGVDEEDQESGYIYILRSLSSDPEVSQMTNLFKIGFSKQPVEERIKRAEVDPTYLMAPVEIVETYKCFNLNPQKFEHLLHRFFSKARVDAEVVDKKQEKYIPGEWFVVPLGVIDQAVRLIINGEVVHYKYDHINEAIDEIGTPGE